MLEIANLDIFKKVIQREDVMPSLSKLKNAGTSVRALYAGDPQRGPLTLNSKIYSLPQSMSKFNSNISISNNKIILISYTGKMHAILIESQEIANALRVLFEYAFKGAESKTEK